MNIGPDIQAEMLFRSFKQTSAIPEIPDEPPPTPGDLVRNVAVEINGDREADIAETGSRAADLWQLKPE